MCYSRIITKESGINFKCGQIHYKLASKCKNVSSKKKQAIFKLKASILSIKYENDRKNLCYFTLLIVYLCQSHYSIKWQASLEIQNLLKSLQDQKHNIQNVHKGEYQPQQSPLSDFTVLVGGLMMEWKLEKALSCNRSLSPDEHAYFTSHYFNYGSS